MSQAIVTLSVVITQIALPCYLAYSLWRNLEVSRLTWCLRAVASAAFFGLIYTTGRWDIVGYSLRFLMPGVLVVAAAAGYMRMRRVPWLYRRGSVLTAAVVGHGMALLLFAALWGYAVQGYSYDEEPVRLSSPLANGVFYVGQGGNSPLINYHNGHATQRYAMDIVELNGLGLRSSSPFSTDLDDYVIFGRPVRSPCDGVVTIALDGRVDNPPPRMDRDEPAGNHVVLECRGVLVHLAHLQRDSVTVQPGDPVTAGEVIGLVGNSGNTSEPHLHIHAVRVEVAQEGQAETPVPILLEGRFGVRNTTFGRIE